MKHSNLLIICFLLLSATVTDSNKQTTDTTNSIRGTETNLNNSNDINPGTSTNVPTSNSSTPSETTNRIFTGDELKQYNGQNGNPAYVAINGTVYDVTNVQSWKNGTHQGLSAGMDLTSELASSPHGDVVLPNLPIVGTLAK
jgi:predicted heme/steroid binding protein